MNETVLDMEGLELDLAGQTGEERADLLDSPRPRRKEDDLVQVHALASYRLADPARRPPWDFLRPEGIVSVCDRNPRPGCDLRPLRQPRREGIPFPPREPGEDSDGDTGGKLGADSESGEVVPHVGGGVAVRVAPESFERDDVEGPHGPEYTPGMLSLAALMQKTPNPVRRRAAGQCRLDKIQKRTLQRSVGNVVEQHWGVSCTDGVRVITLRFHGPVAKNTPVWVSCTCPAWLFFCEVAVAGSGSTSVLYSNGAPPDIRNPNKIPYLCLTGDTLISTRTGLVPLAELVGPGNGPRELGFTLDSHEGAAIATGGVCVGEAQTYRVKSGYGYEVRGTADHPLLVLTPELDLIKRPIGELRPGDRLAVKLDSDVWPETDDLRPGVARILGYLIAEGCLTGAQASFGTTSPTIMKDFTDCFHAAYGTRLHVGEHRNYSGTVSLTCNIPRPLRRELEELGLEKTNSYGKTIPRAVLRGTRQTAAEFLKGYWEGDGHVGENVLRAATVSEKLAAEIQTLLGKLGILASKRMHPKRTDAYGNPTATPLLMHFLTITGAANIQRFAEVVGYISPEDTERSLKAVAVQRMRCEVDLIPWAGLAALRTEMAPLRTALNGRYNLNGDLQSLYLGNRGMRRPGVYRDEVVKVIASLHKFRVDLATKLANVAALPGVFWDTVESVTPAQVEPVYDLRVPGPETFVANGLISGNCKHIFAVAAIGIEETKIPNLLEKLFPKKGPRGRGIGTDPAELRRRWVDKAKQQERSLIDESKRLNLDQKSLLHIPDRLKERLLNVEKDIEDAAGEQFDNTSGRGPWSKSGLPPGPSRGR
jgi:hypothetical protein